jgi:hypothetical protein
MKRAVAMITGAVLLIAGVAINAVRPEAAGVGSLVIIGILMVIISFVAED